ncbi:MAG: glucose 1-dehydrogenase [Betaproteobacteria bacterium]|nr:glucose 1-dehydrogenase [Betaproteobacteria bacterium]
MSRFKGKVAVVTGGGNGIGAATATRLATEGAAVVVADIDEAGARGVTGKIAAAGGRAAACHVDIRVPEQVEAMFELARREFGPAGILINTAGVGAQRYFLDTPLETLAAMYDVNVKGTFLCAQAGARGMIKLGGGRIVNFSSHSGLLGSSGRAAYAASKGGVIALTRVMAIDLAQHGITVNVIAPGPIAVPRQKHNEERREAWLKAVPLARYGTAEDVAGAALFLVSDDASYITGQTISVDGGFTAAGLRVKNPNDYDGVKR